MHGGRVAERRGRAAGRTGRVDSLGAKRRSRAAISHCPCRTSDHEPRKPMDLGEGAGPHPRDADQRRRMAAILRSARGLLVSALLLSACCVDTRADIHPPVNQSCRALCCFEFESPCTTKAKTACEGCDDRCAGDCADASALLGRMQQSSTKFECSPKGVIRPAGEVCATELNDYQSRAAIVRLGEAPLVFAATCFERAALVPAAVVLAFTPPGPADPGTPRPRRSSPRRS